VKKIKVILSPKIMIFIVLKVLTRGQEPLLNTRQVKNNDSIKNIENRENVHNSSEDTSVQEKM